MKRVSHSPTCSPSRIPAASSAARRSARRHEDRAVGIGVAIRAESLHHDARGGSHGHLRAAVCARARAAGQPRRDTTRSEVVLGGRKVTIQRPRVRTAAGEVPLPTLRTMAATDPLDRRVVEQMLVGVATRQYARSLEPARSRDQSRGTSKSAVSRRFVARTSAQLAAWQSAPLDGLDLVALLIDGVHLGDHCLIVALGIAADGQKHALGLWDGSTENATVCQGLLANLQSRGLRTDRSLLVILDGSKALRKAVRATFGDAALVQRCQVHKMRNILDYLNDRTARGPKRSCAARIRPPIRSWRSGYCATSRAASRPSIPVPPRAYAKASMRR